MKLLASLALASLLGAVVGAADVQANTTTTTTTTKKTADQQSMNTNETELTRSIREEIMKTDGLSTYGQNIKVITSDGKVTIKGPVRTEAEKATVLRIARNKAGSTSVVDEVTVVPATN